MPAGVTKVPTTCPRCGHVQPEPPGVISTYCRGCGEYYSPSERPAAGPRAVASAAAPPPKLRRTIRCYECGADHEVSAHAQSTFCPGCGIEISLERVVVARPLTQAVNTRSLLHIEREGFLNCGRATCREAWIEGRFAGWLFCETNLRFGGHGAVRGQLRAAKIVIERAADAEFDRPLVAGEFFIDGRVRGDIECSGGVVIGRHGVITGDIEARWLRIERGAVFSGNVRVLAQREPSVRNGRSPNFYADLRPLPFFGRGNLAFG